MNADTANGQKGPAPCPAAKKLWAWLDAGAKKRLTLTREDFADREFSLNDMLLSGPLPERLQQRWRSFCSYIGQFTPFNPWKMFWYRQAGVSIGKNVYIAPGAVLDFLFPQLITLEDGVVLGMGAMIVAHVYTPERIVVARAVVKKDGLVGGRAILAISTIGEKGILGANSYTTTPIPAGHIALGVPAIARQRKVNRPTRTNNEDEV